MCLKKIGTVRAVDGDVADLNLSMHIFVNTFGMHHTNLWVIWLPWFPYDVELARMWKQQIMLSVNRLSINILNYGAMQSCGIWIAK